MWRSVEGSKVSRAIDMKEDLKQLKLLIAEYLRLQGDAE
jgi:hypothetical protein